MAEAVFRDIVQKAGLADTIKIDSCGTGGWHQGEPAHDGTLEVLQRNEVDGSYLIARQLTQKDFSDFSIHIPMDKQNALDIAAFAKKHSLQQPPTKLLMSFVKHAHELEVPDPYYTGEFDRVFDLVTQGSISLLEWCKKQSS